MKFEYLVPKYIPDDCIKNMSHYRQHKDGSGYIPSINALSITSSDLMDYGQRLHTPSGTGGKLISIYNFTATPICMLDSNNAFTVVEPIRYNGDFTTLDYNGKIVIEVLYQNQDYALSTQSANYLNMRRRGLRGIEAGRMVDALYNDTGMQWDTLESRATEHQRFRFLIDDPVTMLKTLGGAGYFRDVDIVITLMENPQIIWLHPKSDPLLLKKARPRLKGTDSMGIDMYINDPDHVYDRVFISVANTAVEIPISRDPSYPSGVYIWTNIHDPDSKPIRYDLLDQNCPFRIYRSRTDAVSGGQPDKLLEKELIDKKQKLAQDKLEQDREEFQRQKEQFEQQRQRQKEADARQEREYQRQKERDHQNEKYEKVSFWRKMLVEGTKAFAAAVTTAAVIVGWYMKQKATA